MTMMYCRAAAKELAVSLLAPNLHAANALHAVVRVAVVVRKNANPVNRNQRNGLVASQHATRDRRGNLSQLVTLNQRGRPAQLGILNRSGSHDQLGSLDRNVKPDQVESLDLPLQVTKLKHVAALGLHSSRLSFRTFRPGKKPSAAWHFERHLKNTHAELKAAVVATAVVARHVAKTDLAKDV